MLPAHTPPSPNLHPSKRARQASPAPYDRSDANTQRPLDLSAGRGPASPPRISSLPSSVTAPSPASDHPSSYHRACSPHDPTVAGGGLGGPSGSPTAAAAAAAFHSPNAGLLSGDAAPSSSSSGGGSGGGGGSGSGNSHHFRNVSACNRCRLRKNRCDQRLPSCASCEKAGLACVGYDLISKREVPRSYVFYLETRASQLEAILTAHGIALPPADDLEHCSKPASAPSSALSPVATGYSGTPQHDLIDNVGAANGIREPDDQGRGRAGSDDQATTKDVDDAGRLQKLVDRSGMAAIPGAANPRYLGSLSGVSFARVVFAAVQSSVSDQKSTSDKAGVRPYKPVGGTSMRDSFFGLHTKPTIHPAPFPDKELAHRLVTLYLEYANPQIPVLHKVDFMGMFEQAYAEDEAQRVRGPRQLYMLNIVYAIGSAIFLGEPAKPSDQALGGGLPTLAKQPQPEEYHASAIVHLEACLGSASGLEELQAVLLLANFALLRPVPPGLWYIIGVAVRLAVDLGLHYEDGKDIHVSLDDAARDSETLSRERGRREYVRDLRRRLWWCTYSLDRLVSVCVGRPFGCSDQVITTEFPSLLEDRFITPTGFIQPPAETAKPTYKLVAKHYFRLRLLQSEILQVLQFQQAQMARVSNPHMHTSLPSPFLSRFDSFRSWRIDIDKRLWEWKTSAPTKQETGVAFSVEFLDLNYWQAIIMLYRQSLSVPAMFEGEYNTSNEVNSPSIYNVELSGDEDRVYLKVAEAGQRILRLYRQLHVVGLVNYTYLATHHLFMAGISYLYAIWHSPIVRSRLTMDEFDFTVLAAKSVFTDLMEKCPPAEACRDAFDRTAKATIKMANSTGGFGKSAPTTSPAMRMSESAGEWNPQHRGSPQGIYPQPRQQTMASNAANFPSSSASSSNVFSSSSNGASFGMQQQQFRAPAVKDEQDGNVFVSMMRVGAGNSLDINMETRGAAGTISNAGAFLLSSPRAGGIPQQQQQTPSPNNGMSSPINSAGSMLAQQQARTPSTTATAMQIFLSPTQAPQQQSVFSPSTVALGDLWDMGSLQSLEVVGPELNDTSGGEDGHSNGPVDATSVDFGFGLGWEGLHHDFSNGQQLDLFDGFFFGG